MQIDAMRDAIFFALKDKDSFKCKFLLDEWEKEYLSKYFIITASEFNYTFKKRVKK